MVDTISLGKCVDVSYTDSGTIVKAFIEKPAKTTTIWDIWAQYFSNITEAKVCLSGGIDSQFSLQIARKLGVKVQAVTYAGIWQDSVVNSRDLVTSQRLCQEWDIPLEIIDIDLYDFLNSSELVELALQYKTASPQVACHLKFLSKLGNSSPVIMGGEPPIFYYYKLTAGHSTVETAFKDQIVSITAPYYAYASKTNLTLFKELFYLDPQSLYLGYEKNLQLATDRKIYLYNTLQKASYDYNSYFQAANKFNSMLYKTEFYRSFGIDIRLPILKNTGFEDLKKHMALYSGIYNEFDLKYRYPLEDLLSEKLWYKNFFKFSALDQRLNYNADFNDLTNTYKTIVESSTDLKDLYLYNFDF